MGIMTDYWFIPTYIGLYILSPVLNSFINTYEDKYLLKYIIIFYIFQLLMSLPFTAVDSFNRGYSILSFCGLYMIGAYIKRTTLWELPIFSTNTKVFGWIVLITSIISVTVFMVGVVLHRSGEQLVTMPLISFVYNNPIVIIQSTLIFIFFIKLKISSKVINWFAGGALSIYLLHMHPDIKEDFYGYARGLYSEQVLIQLLSIILLIFAIVLIAIPIDKIRIRLFDAIYLRSSKLLAVLRKYKHSHR